MKSFELSSKNRVFKWHKLYNDYIWNVKYRVFRNGKWYFKVSSRFESRVDIYKTIDKFMHKYTINKLCKIHKISESAYFYYKSDKYVGDKKYDKYLEKFN